MSFFMQTTSESLYLHKTLTTVTIMGKIRADFKGNSCGKNMEAVDAWKKRVYHLVHIHVRAPENGGITNGNTAEAGSGLRHSRLIRFCLRRNTGGETC